MNPTLSGIIAILMWSVSPLLILGAGNTPPFLMTSMALIIASLFLLFEALLRKKNVKKIVSQPAIAYMLTTFGIGGYVVFWFLGFKNAPAFEANTLNYLWPILLVFFSCIVVRETLPAAKIFGLLLGFVGTLLLFLQSDNAGFHDEFFWGYIFSLTAAIIWATYSTATRFINFPNRAMLSFLFVPGLISLLIHFSFEDLYLPSTKELLFILLLGLTRISFLFWDYAMKYGRISLISSLAYFIPVISTTLLMLFGHIPRNEMVLFSALMILTGCIIVNLSSITGAISIKFHR